MTYTLDTSAAIEIALDRPKSAALSDMLSQAKWVISPDLFISEATNVFWKYHQHENLPLEICETTLDMTLGLIDDFIDSYSLYKEAFALACLARHSVYDCMYLVLTRRHNGILFTTDKRLIQLAEKYSIRAMQKS